jgi:hypothetical protein
MADPNAPRDAEPIADVRRGAPAADDGEARSFDAPEGQRPDTGAPRGRGAHADGPGADSVMPGREFGAGGQIDDGPRNTPGDPAAQARSARADGQAPAERDDVPRGN